MSEKSFLAKDINIYLRFIGNLPSGHVIDLTNWRYQDPKSWWTTISRYYYGESREKTAKYLGSLIDQVEKLMNQTKEPGSETLLKNLEHSKRGISNLVDVYRDQSITYCELEALNDKINEILKKHKNGVRQINLNVDNGQLQDQQQILNQQALIAQQISQGQLVQANGRPVHRYNRID